MRVESSQQALNVASLPGLRSGFCKFVKTPPLYYGY